MLVHNQFGVINRVTSMFRRRRFNIDNLTVSETESADYSRITVQFAGDEVTKQQLVHQLYKLPDVCSVAELDPQETVSRELLLIKVRNNPEDRGDIRSASDAYKGEIVDYTKDAMVIQMVGEGRKIDNFIQLMQDFEIMEISRTGIIALQRGEETIRRGPNL